jgi:hypothetical protein
VFRGGVTQIGIGVFTVNLCVENTMKVIHKDQEHLFSFTSDDVALLLDLCFAVACSELLASTNTVPRPVSGALSVRFMSAYWILPSRSGWQSGGLDFKAPDQSR